MLHLAALYRRDVAASVARVWENVFDWEHLPALHATSFAGCERLADGPWGWRVRLTSPGLGAQVVALAADREAGRYIVTTEQGLGAGTEVRTALTPRGSHLTGVDVAFHLPEPDAVRREMIGRGYVAAYRRLWDEDEAMMIGRERELGARAAASGEAGPTALGPEDAVRASLPLAAWHDGRRWRVIERDGALLAHAAVCPHWLGPLDDVAVDAEGCVTCPWHGYRFDVASGRSADGRGLRLPPAPRVETRDGLVWLA